MLWAITAYFNPVGYRRRVLNYQVFRKRLGVPLIAVECSFGGGFELKPGDAEVLIQIRDADIMWQKERLLNVALGSLPAECTAVAWLDCDIVFMKRDWADRAIAALEGAAVVHLYRERYHPPRNTRPGDLETVSLTPIAESTVHLIRSGRGDIEMLSQAGLAKGWTNGLAWAARRDLLEENGLYDACILGSGDRAILCAAYGRFEVLKRGLLMNAARYEHYLSWARPFHTAARGHVTAIDGSVLHLWHGALETRSHETRHQGFQRFDFNPWSDLTLSASGAWQWSSDKPALHAHVREYFWSRKEDGGGETSDRL